MLNFTKEEEIEYLAALIKKLAAERDRIHGLIEADSESIADTKRYMHEKVYEMDPAEVRSNRQMLESMIDAAYNLVIRRARLDKMKSSPYFGRISFAFDDLETAGKVRRGSIVDDEGNPQIYIGIHSHMEDLINVIYDWRAPISSMFYDFETGEASYTAPKGLITGKINLKRQYKITDGSLGYMLESSIKIDDEILQEQLAKATSDKMKNIVATIQREQNAIIRNESSDVLVIQGVAGSGKTSIALHRIAYLLYRLKNKIYSENMMIISPNKVFSDYISNVLPELGEEQILQMTFDDITEHEIGELYEYQSAYEQIEYMLENDDEFLTRRIGFKSTNEFLDLFNEYIKHTEETNFTPADFTYFHETGGYEVKSFEVSAYYITDRYNAYKRYPMQKRAEMIMEDITNKIIDYYNITEKKIRRNYVKNAVHAMFKERDILKLYKNFYKYIKRENMCSANIDKEIPYDDLAPLLYLKSALYGVDTFLYIKHLLVDEMQDYTPTHYAFFNKLFVCKKTILGDINQLVNPFSKGSSDESIAFLYEKQPRTKVQTMQLKKSFRSTTEITDFAARIIKKDNIEVVERHGEVPAVEQCESKAAQVARIIAQVRCNSEAGLKSSGIICKTRAQARALYDLLFATEETHHIVLLDEGSEKFDNRLVITTAYLAKGLEFDSITIPDADSKNYRTELDRQMLYIAATRALHRVTVLYSGERTRLIADS